MTCWYVLILLNSFVLQTLHLRLDFALLIYNDQFLYHYRKMVLNKEPGKSTGGGSATGSSEFDLILSEINSGDTEAIKGLCGILGIEYDKEKIEDTENYPLKTDCLFEEWPETYPYTLLFEHLEPHSQSKPHLGHSASAYCPKAKTPENWYSRADRH